MDAWLKWIGALTVVMQIVVLGGLFARQRAHRAWALPVYLSVATLLQALRIVWGDLARRWDYWALKETLLRILMVIVAVEISVRVFAGMPRARGRALVSLAAVSIGTVVAVLQAPGVAHPEGAAWPHVLVVEVLPRIAVGAVLLCVGVLVVMAFYRVPLDPLHRETLFGVALFLIAYAGPIGSADDHEFGRFVMYRVTPVIYLAVLAVWAWAAWRDEQEPVIPPEIRDKVQPWQRVGHF